MNSQVLCPVSPSTLPRESRYPPWDCCFHQEPARPVDAPERQCLIEAIAPLTVVKQSNWRPTSTAVQEMTLESTSIPHSSHLPAMKTASTTSGRNFHAPRV